MKFMVSLFITPEIAEEFGLPLPEWVKVKSVKDKKYQSFLETQVYRGEASVIALASEHEDALLVTFKKQTSGYPIKWSKSY